MGTSKRIPGQNIQTLRSMDNLVDNLKSQGRDIKAIELMQERLQR
jgi:hypothetical protein